ncbi:MAG: hypothetical protein QM692_17785 [Thermomicrobiales bacterium]
MTDRESLETTGPGDPGEDLDRALVTAADVDSAGRSCLLIVAMVIVILALLGVWIIYTRSQGA